MTTVDTNHRILIVDDNPAIHEDFRKILAGTANQSAVLERAEAVLFGAIESMPVAAQFEIDSSFQGNEALDKVFASIKERRPYALAFVDIRMPPGWDGVETIEQLWKVDPRLQIVVCTAYSDYSWERMNARLGANDSLVILKKPFDNVEVIQLAHALTKKWQVTQQAHLRMETLDRMVNERTQELQVAMAKLQRSEERFAKAFRAIPIPLAIQTFTDCRFVDVNDAFVSMTGYSREELIGQTPLDVRLCLDFEGRILSRVRAGELVTNAEAQISTKAGDLRTSLLTLERIDVSGEPHVLLMVQDVSERLRLEEQLRQSQKMEAIGQLAAGVAHDFNNLLTIIEGHTSLQLGAPGLTDDIGESLQQIQQAAERAANLTRQLLAFSRRQIMRPRVLDLNTLIRDLTAMLRRLLTEQIDLLCEFDEALPRIYADPTSLEQVIMNLALNARDAMPNGGSITVSTHAVTLQSADVAKNPDARPGAFVRLSVTDTGVGMDEATRTRIFEPFFTTKEAPKGTGMGLATVYGIARQHEGWVEVSTALGRGSTFHVYLPVTERMPEVGSELTPEPADGDRPHTILIVEDDEAVRALVKEILTHHGYRVLEAEHADAAFRVWAEHRNEVELLLTDMVMPGSANGLQLSRRLLEDRPDLRVIYTSGYSTELFSSDVHLEDGVNYLPKPYLSSKLINILRNALKSPQFA